MWQRKCSIMDENCQSYMGFQALNEVSRPGWTTNSWHIIECPPRIRCWVPPLLIIPPQTIKPLLWEPNISRTRLGKLRDPRSFQIKSCLKSQFNMYLDSSANSTLFYFFWFHWTWRRYYLKRALLQWARHKPLHKVQSRKIFV